MGMSHYLAARKLRGAQVTAVCSRDPKKLAGDWRSIQGNFGPRGEMMDLSAVKKYDWLDALLEAARRAGRLLMVAHVLPFMPEFAYAPPSAAAGTGRRSSRNSRETMTPPPPSPPRSRPPWTGSQPGGSPTC